MDYYFGNWYCCLNPREAFLISSITPFFVIPGSFIEKTTFNAFALVAGFGSNILLLDNFIATYHLIEGVFTIPDEPPLEVYYFDPLFWLPFVSFQSSPDAACTDGCELKGFDA
jgi:hypothetical protein